MVMLQGVIWQIFLGSSTCYHQRVWQRDMAVGQWGEDVCSNFSITIKLILFLVSHHKKLQHIMIEQSRLPQYSKTY